MANIVPSDLHPDTDVRYTLASAEPFTLGSGGSYETFDRVALAEAERHPWLNVELSEQENPTAIYRPGSISPEDDSQSAQNSEAFDPDAIERDRVVFASDDDRTAIEAGQDQGEVKTIETGDVSVATTLAADAKQDDDEGDNDF